MEESLLRTLVAWVLSSGGAGVIGYWIVEKWLVALTPENKRYAAYALTWPCGLSASPCSISPCLVTLAPGSRAW